MSRFSRPSTFTFKSRIRINHASYLPRLGSPLNLRLFHVAIRHNYPGNNYSGTNSTATQSSLSDEAKKQQEKEGTQVTLVGLGSNVALTIGKGIGGVVFGSASLIADAVHSLSDLVSDGVALAAYKRARRERDALYPYGHGKLEPLGSLTISTLLLAAGIGTGLHSVDVLRDLLTSMPDFATAVSHTQQQLTLGLHSLNEPKIAAAALSLAGLSIAVKEALFHWTLRIGRKQNSQILIANAYHHRADSASGLVALGGVAGAYFGYAWMDPVGGLLVSGLIVQQSISMISPALRELRDGADLEVVQKVEDVLKRVQAEDKNITGFHSIRARKMGPEALVDLQVQVNPRITVSLAHQISENARHAITNQVPGISEVLIHVDVDAPDHNAAPPTATSVPTSDIEDDIIKKTLRGMESEVKRISHLQVHYLSGGMEIDAEIVLNNPENLSLNEAIAIALKVQDKLMSFPGVISADVHLETNEDHYIGRDGNPVSKRWKRGKGVLMQERT
ncbi:hypothetical protein HDU79_005481 [Rhizoclosmatium sp. JEL0117]|nr:hypothetical protein HDU79_005481 [Rhizoclosmatium sp. JEL0117]